jgi:hypothetical protein
MYFAGDREFIHKWLGGHRGRDGDVGQRSMRSVASTRVLPAGFEEKVVRLRRPTPGGRRKRVPSRVFILPRRTPKQA